MKTTIRRRGGGVTMKNIFQPLSLSLIQVAAAAALLLLGHSTAFVDAAVACNESITCERMFFKGSQCVDGFCDNSYQTGCLHTYYKYLQLDNETIYQSLLEAGRSRIRNNSTSDDDKDEKSKNSPLDPTILEFLKQFGHKKRVCNSHDTAATRSTCVEPLFEDYQEIRLITQNWESAMLATWILQIVLSELLGVPSSIESSGPGRNFNFYDPGNSFSYGAKSYDWDALRNGNALGDCRSIDNFNATAETYVSCGHVMSEVWNGQAAEYIAAEREGYIEPPEGTSAVGKLAWFVPRFVGRKDPSLLSYLGLQGQANRHKVARTFKRPTTWHEYCNLVSYSNCSKPDHIAERYPADETEGGKYHKAGLYKGYFRDTEKNNCKKWPLNCTGHIVDLPCTWSTLVTPQYYHLDIPVESNGPMEPNGGYNYGQLLDIWSAANATKSPVLYNWWLPDPMYQRFLHTEAEFTMVQLPPPSQECVSSRITPEDRCSDNFEDRVGDPAGACDSEFHSLLKLVTGSLYRNLNKMDEVKRSPAYETVKGLAISELQVGQIFDYWEARGGIDYWNYDARNATCQWAIENLDYLQTLVPRSYPRVIQEENNYGDVLFIVGFALAVLVAVIDIGISICTYVFRDRPIMQYAQVGFLYMLLVGLFLVSLASMMLVQNPTTGSCIARAWFATLGYTLELVPLIVKVGAINKMMQAARKMKRIHIQHKDLYGTVGAIVAIVIVFLICWTAIDPPVRADLMTLSTKQTQYDHTIVTLTHYCSSRDQFWKYMAVGWQCVLLCCATVLAYQTRNLRQDFNESQTLAFMIYSHFVFISLQLLTFVLEDAFPKDTLEAVRSYIYSVDALVAMQVYFVPKLFKVNETIQDRRSSRGSSYCSFESDASRQSASHRASSFVAGAGSGTGGVSGLTDSDFEHPRVRKFSSGVSSQSSFVEQNTGGPSYVKPASGPSMNSGVSGASGQSSASTGTGTGGTQPIARENSKPPVPVLPMHRKPTTKEAAAFAASFDDTEGDDDPNDSNDDPNGSNDDNQEKQPLLPTRDLVDMGTQTDPIERNYVHLDTNESSLQPAPLSRASSSSPSNEGIRETFSNECATTDDNKGENKDEQEEDDNEQRPLIPKSECENKNEEQQPSSVKNAVSSRSTATIDNAAAGLATSTAIATKVQVLASQPKQIEEDDEESSDDNDDTSDEGGAEREVFQDDYVDDDNKSNNADASTASSKSKSTSSSEDGNRIPKQSPSTSRYQKYYKDTLLTNQLPELPRQLQDSNIIVEQRQGIANADHSQVTVSNSEDDFNDETKPLNHESSATTGSTSSKTTTASTDEGSNSNHHYPQQSPSTSRYQKYYKDTLLVNQEQQIQQQPKIQQPQQQIQQSQSLVQPTSISQSPPVISSRYESYYTKQQQQAQILPVQMPTQLPVPIPVVVPPREYVGAFIPPPPIVPPPPIGVVEVVGRRGKIFENAPTSNPPLMAQNPFMVGGGKQANDKCQHDTFIDVEQQRQQLQKQQTHINSHNDGDHHDESSLSSNSNHEANMAKNKSRYEKYYNELSTSEPTS